MADSPTPITLGGIGNVDMYPMETRDAARAVHGAGKSWAGRWGALESAITAAEGQLGKGNDTLGANFRANYNPYSEAALPAAALVDDIYQGLGVACLEAVLKYVEVDHQIIPAWFRAIEDR